MSIQNVPWINAAMMRKWHVEALETRGNIWAVRFVVLAKYFQHLLQQEMQKNVERRAG